MIDDVPRAVVAVWRAAAAVLGYNSRLGWIDRGRGRERICLY